MKVFKQFLIGIVASVLFTVGVNAASGSIVASTSTKTAAVGSTFTVTVKVTCSEAIGSWQFGVYYDTSHLSIVSGDTTVAGYGDGSKKTQTYTYKFKAIKSGSANISISSPMMVSWNDDSSLFTPSSSGVTVAVKTQSEIEASYSKDNYLKSLSVEGYELSPAFDKETTNYTVSVPDTATEIKVSASVNDSNSRVSGTGVVDLSEGKNKVEVVVTAQNGSVKTYTILVDVKDLNPIEVNVDGKNYSVVKKAELLPVPTGFTPTTIKIDDIEVPAFNSEMASLTVVGLKDEEGNIGLFTYDADANAYRVYRELKGASLTLLPKEITDIPKGFSKINLKIGDEEYEVLKSDTIKDFYLVHAMNIEDGKVGYFIYDSVEHSFVTYNKDAFDEIIEKSEEYKLYLIACSIVAGTLFLIAIIMARKNSKLKKIIKVKLEELREQKDNQYQKETTKNAKKSKHKNKNEDDDDLNE